MPSRRQDDLLGLHIPESNPVGVLRCLYCGFAWAGHPTFIRTRHKRQAARDAASETPPVRPRLGPA